MNNNLNSNLNRITENDSKKILGMISALLSVLLLFGVISIHNHILSIGFFITITVIILWTLRKEIKYLIAIMDIYSKIMLLLIIIGLIVIIIIYRKQILNKIKEDFKENYYNLFKPGKPYPGQEIKKDENEINYLI